MDDCRATVWVSASTRIVDVKSSRRSKLARHAFTAPCLAPRLGRSHENRHGGIVFNLSFYLGTFVEENRDISVSLTRFILTATMAGSPGPPDGYVI